MWGGPDTMSILENRSHCVPKLVGSMLIDDYNWVTDSGEVWN